MSTQRKITESFVITIIWLLLFWGGPPQKLGEEFAWPAAV